MGQNEVRGNVYPNVIDVMIEIVLYLELKNENTFDIGGIQYELIIYDECAI